jgi:hypothetical protein
MRTRLPVIRVGTPCQTDWNLMAGSSQVRFCDSCQKNVYNLSAMPPSQVEALIASGLPVCIRMRKPKRVWAAAAALLLGFFGVARADNSLPKDKHDKGRAGAEKKEKEPQKKPARRPEDFIQGDLLIDRD